MKISFSGSELQLRSDSIDGFWFQHDQPLKFPATVTVTNLSGESATVTLQVEDITDNNEIAMAGSI